MKTCNLAIVVSTLLQLMSYCRCMHFVFCGNDFQIDKGLKANTLIVIQDVFVVLFCQIQKLNIPHFLQLVLPRKMLLEFIFLTII